MKKYAFTKLLVAACCIIGICSLYAPPSYAAYNGIITDNFDGPSLNTRLWRPCQDDQTKWVQQGGELRITLAQGAAGGECVQVESKFLLKGDFEMTVDYRLITWPAANGGRLGFEGPGYSGTDYTMCMLKRVSHGVDEQPNPGEEVFAASFKEGAAWSANEMETENTPGEHGTLKLTRAGNRMTGSFSKNDGPWTEITFRDYSPSGLPEWYPIALSVCGRPFTNVEIAFDNFQVSYDQVEFISDLSPLTLLLLD
jgi:hypothetical protein